MDVLKNMENNLKGAASLIVSDSGYGSLCFLLIRKILEELGMVQINSLNAIFFDKNIIICSNSFFWVFLYIGFIEPIRQ